MEAVVSVAVIFAVVCGGCNVCVYVYSSYGICSCCGGGSCRSGGSFGVCRCDNPPMLRLASTMDLFPARMICMMVRDRGCSGRV